MRLWDGNEYCRDCVDRACADLWDFARGHPTLEDNATIDWRAVL